MNGLSRIVLPLTMGMAAALAAGCMSSAAPKAAAQPAQAHGAHRVIVFVWDGMRPDSISEADTPHLAALAKRGTFFADNHSSYPTFTMMNAAAFATGAFSGTSGFFGNTLYRPGAPARDSGGEYIDLNSPVFTEDYGVLKQLDANQDRHLFLVGTLFQAAQKAGLTTVAVGKSGPAFIQDYKNGSYVLDEKAAFPLSFAKELQAAHIPLPATTAFAYRNGELKLGDDNGDPTFQPRPAVLADGVTVNPDDRSGSPPAASNKYLMSVYLDYILPQKKPDLSVVWLRNPDSTEHPYGVGSPNYHLALKAQDELLGQLEEKLAQLGIDKSTDLIVVSDHAHSNVSGPLDLFPLRKVENGKMGQIDREHGYSVSGDVRLAHELSMAGIRAYDGGGCAWDPVMTGITAEGKQLQPDKDVSGERCGSGYHGKKYTSPDYELLHPFLPREAFVVAANGGSDYLYQPDHDPERVRMAVRFLQSREEFGAIFVDERYGEIPGTLPLSRVRLENSEGRNPDIVVGYTFDENAVIQGMPGIEFEGTNGHNSHGMHGSFSPRDVHNTLVAAGPDFAANFTDTLPSGNVDLAPTIARIFGFDLPQADGRPLLEALSAAHVNAGSYSVQPRTITPSQASTGLKVLSPLGTDTGKTTYSFQLQVKELHQGERRWTYFDWAKAQRN
jgi:arylsulfatase A-like enzyme